MLPNGGWFFEWSSTGAEYYRIVLQGREIDKVADIPSSMQSYTYQGANFIAYPPPLEIVPSDAGMADSEINKPFLIIQWYGVEASYYAIQELIDADWRDMFRIEEIGAQVYSWSTPLLADQTTHNYRVLAYNSIEQASTPLEFDIDVVTPPEFVDTDFTIDYVGTNIVLDFVE